MYRSCVQGSVELPGLQQNIILGSSPLKSPPEVQDSDEEANLSSNESHGDVDAHVSVANNMGVVSPNIAQSTGMNSLILNFANELNHNTNQKSSRAQAKQRQSDDDELDAQQTKDFFFAYKNSSSKAGKEEVSAFQWDFQKPLQQARTSQNSRHFRVEEEEKFGGEQLPPASQNQFEF